MFCASSHNFILFFMCFIVIFSPLLLLPLFCTNCVVFYSMYLTLPLFLWGICLSLLFFLFSLFCLSFLVSIADPLLLLYELPGSGYSRSGKRGNSGRKITFSDWTWHCCETTFDNLTLALSAFGGRKHCRGGGNPLIWTGPWAKSKAAAGIWTRPGARGGAVVGARTDDRAYSRQAKQPAQDGRGYTQWPPRA